MQSYGTPWQTEGQTKLPATTWTLDNYGEWLLAVSTTDQKIWCWKPRQKMSQAFKELENAPAMSLTGGDRGAVCICFGR